MKLFEDKERTDNSPCKRTENTYSFYDRSAWPCANNVRKLLNEWFENYPDQEKSKLKENLKRDFHPNFYELFLHELFLKQGYEIEIHPVVTEGTPDFKIKGEEEKFYVEAKVCKGMSKMDEGEENLKNNILDIIDKKINSGRFFIEISQVKLKGEGEDPSKKDIVGYIQKKMRGIEPIEQNDRGPLPNKKDFVFEDEKVKILFSIGQWTYDPPSGEHFRSIGIEAGEPFWGAPWETLREDLEQKASKYKELDLPYVICVNFLAEFPLDKETVEGALLGSPMAIGSISEKGKTQVEVGRAKDGFFGNPQNSRNTNVNAVLLTDLTQREIHFKPHWLWENPFAEHSFNLGSIGLYGFRAEGNNFSRLDGSSIREVLELSENWLYSE